MVGTVRVRLRVQNRVSANFELEGWHFPGTVSGWESGYKLESSICSWADIERICLITSASRAGVVETINIKKPRKHLTIGNMMEPLLHLCIIQSRPHGSATANSRLGWIWTPPDDTWQPQIGGLILWCWPPKAFQFGHPRLLHFKFSNMQRKTIQLSDSNLNDISYCHIWTEFTQPKKNSF